MTVSKRNDGGPVDVELLEKTMVSGRVAKYVVKYAKDHDVSISDLIMAGFDRYRENDARHALERLSYHENRVLHWKGIVLHNEQECNTKTSICNTIRDEFKKAGRGSPGDRRLDLNWLENKLKLFMSQGIPMSVEELYQEVTK